MNWIIISYSKVTINLSRVTNGKNNNRLPILELDEHPKDAFIQLIKKKNQLFLFINPFLEKSSKVSQELMAEIEPVLPKNLIQSDFNLITQPVESYCKILSHGGKSVCIADNWRGGRDLNPRPPA